MGEYINFNGKFLLAGDPAINSRSRALKYGEGLFETMRIFDRSILFSNLHEQRLFNGIKILGFETGSKLNWIHLEKEIYSLLEKNEQFPNARVRLTLIRGEEGSNEGQFPAQYMIESASIDPYRFLQNGLLTDIFPHARKSIDQYSNLKTCNYLPNLMSMQYAKDHGIDECLLLNSFDRICEGTISNIFWVKGDEIFTPPLSEGMIAGVLRSWIISKLASEFSVQQIPLEQTQLMEADEIFLTNVIRGIRWVKTFKGMHFSNKITSSIYVKFLQSLEI